MSKIKPNIRYLIIGWMITIFLVCLLFNLNIHLTGFKDDGDLFYKPLINKYNGNYLDFLVNRYNTWSSRSIIEIFTLLGVTQPIIWRCLNTLMMWIAAILPAYIIQKKDKVNIYGLILSAALFFTFPLTFFSETGWIATTTNYLWVFSMGLLSIYPLARYTRKEKKHLWLSIVGIIATLYATNQEQMALLILAFTIILGIFNWYKKRSIKPLLPTFIIGTLNLIYVLTARGNEIRYNQELTNWFPDFEKLSIPKKIELGYSSTLRHLFFDKQSTILLFLFLLFVFTLSSQIYRKKFSFIGIFGLLPLPISLLFSFNEYLQNGRVLEVLNNFNQYGTTINLLDTKTWIPDILLTILLMSILVAIIYLLDYQVTSYVPLLFICAAIVSRLIMGFSPTIWASATRTYLFTFGLFNLTFLYLFTNCQTFKFSKALVWFSCILVGCWSIIETIGSLR